MPVSPNDLVTVAQVKSYLGIKDVDASADVLLQTLITAASVWMVNQLHRPIKQGTFTDKLNGDNTAAITLPRAPVTAISSLKIDGEPIDVQTIVNEPGYVLLNNRVYLVGYLFTAGVANIEVSYTAGYTTVPEDLVLGCLDLVAYVYRSRDRHGVQSRSVPSGETITFRAEDVPFMTKFALDAYRTVLGVPQ